MEHHFDPEVAVEYGLNAAIILEHLAFWIKKNAADEVNFFDGEYWTFTSRKACNELFPYMSKRQIELAFKKLMDGGLIRSGNYNENPMDRTLWYSLTEKGKCISHFGAMHFTFHGNEVHSTSYEDSTKDISNISNNIKAYREKERKEIKENDSLTRIRKEKEKTRKNGGEEKNAQELKTPDLKNEGFAHDSEPYRAAVYLSGFIQQRLPTLKPPDEKRLQSWADAFDKCQRIDGHRWKEIGEVLTFSQEDDFWKKNILSGAKFRKQYATLLSHMLAEREKKGRGSDNVKPVLSREEEMDKVEYPIGSGIYIPRKEANRRVQVDELVEYPEYSGNWMPPWEAERLQKREEKQ